MLARKGRDFISARRSRQSNSPACSKRKLLNRFRVSRCRRERPRDVDPMLKPIGTAKSASIRHLLSREYQLLISGQNTFQNRNGWKPVSSCWRELTIDELPENPLAAKSTLGNSSGMQVAPVVYRRDQLPLGLQEENGD